MGIEPEISHIRESLHMIFIIGMSPKRQLCLNFKINNVDFFILSYSLQ